MPTYLTVTSTAYQVIVYFNDAMMFIPESTGRRKANSFPKNSISYFTLNQDASAILVYVNGGGEWSLDMNGIKGLPVSSVNGVTPTSNTHLFELLSLL
jgi:hypothetical protein